MTAPEVLTRPNGKAYRRRAPLRVEMFTTYDGTEGVAVLGTHDIERARALADRLLTEYELDPDSPRKSWWRLVPWDASGMFDRAWVADEVRGAPCVVWTDLR